MARDFHPGDLLIAPYDGPAQFAIITSEKCRCIKHSVSYYHWHYFSPTPKSSTGNPLREIRTYGVLHASSSMHEDWILVEYIARAKQ